MDSLVLQVGWLHTPRPAVGQASSEKIFSSELKNILKIKNISLPSKPVGEPGHVAVTVERVGDKVETCQTADNS